MSVTYSGDNIAFADGSTIASGWTGFKNRIINGAMGIWQRGTSFAGVSNTTVFSADRFYYENAATNTGAYTLSQSTDVPAGQGFPYSLTMTVTTAQTSAGTSGYVGFCQPIEAFNLQDFAYGTGSASSSVLSFWVKSNLTGTFVGNLCQQQNSNRVYPFTYTINASNTWQQIVIPVTGDVSGLIPNNNGSGLRLELYCLLGSNWYAGAPTVQTWTANGSDNKWSVGAGTNVLATIGNTFRITGVQLERGSTASSFEYRPYGTELILCQRYYQKTYDIGEVPGTNTGASYWNAGTTIISSTTTWGASWRFPVEMRATPTATAYTASGTAGSLTFAYGNASGTGAVTEFGKGTKAVSFYHNGTASGMTAGGAAVLIGHIVVSAEL